MIGGQRFPFLGRRKYGKLLSLKRILNKEFNFYKQNINQDISAPTCHTGHRNPDAPYAEGLLREHQQSQDLLERQYGRYKQFNSFYFLTLLLDRPHRKGALLNLIQQVYLNCWTHQQYCRQ